MNAFVDSLDIVKIGYKNANPSDTGLPGFDPMVILKLYIWIYEQDYIFKET